MFLTCGAVCGVICAVIVPSNPERIFPSIPRLMEALHPDSFDGQVLHAACVPLFEMIRRWVFEGQIEDPHGEFFIVGVGGAAASGTAADPAAAAAAGDMWRSGYAIDGSRLPRFLSQKLAARILRAGKSVNFLQESCGDVAWVQERAMSAQAAAAAAVSIGQVRGVERGERATCLVLKKCPKQRCISLPSASHAPPLSSTHDT